MELQRVSAATLAGTALASLFALAPLSPARAQSAAAPAQSGPDAAGAQDTVTSRGAPSRQLEEVVVTATRQGATPLQKTPLAVSVLSANTLAQTGALNVKDLVQLTPSVNVAQQTASAQIYIRGIGTNATGNGSDPDVTLQVDGVYMARAFTQFVDFVDVDRVEILRGPQGTLYGRNAVGGVINIISRQPTDQFVGQEQLTVGSYGTFQNQAFLSGPIVRGVLDGSISINYIRHDGYDKNIAPGSEDRGSANRGGIRGQLRWRPTSWLDATTRVDYNQVDENFQSYDHILAPEAFPTLSNSIIGQYHKVSVNNATSLRETLDGVAEEVNIKLSPELSLKSLTAYRYSHNSFTSDPDATEFTIQYVPGIDTAKQFSQELNLNGHFGRLDFVSGLYYFREDQKTFLQSVSPPSIIRPAAAGVLVQAIPVSFSESKAVFAQGSYQILPSLKLTVGGRYTQDLKDFTGDFRLFSYSAPPTVGAQRFAFAPHTSPTFSAFTPKVGLDWQARPNVLLYASYAEGFKSGGNNAVATSPVGITYQPEDLKSYEAGLKSDLFDRRLRLNLSVFNYDYTNLQVQSLVGAGVITVTNAATATVRGLEVESIAQVTPNLRFSANLSLLSAKYDSYLTASVPAALVSSLSSSSRYSAGPPATFNASGNTLNAAPKVSYSLVAQYTQPLPQGEAYGRADWYWQDRVFYDPSNVPIMSQAPYGVVNLAVGYSSPGARWNAEIIVRNALDEGYFISKAANGLVPSALSGAPRVVLFRVTRNF